jgi:hypothetical protein
MPSLGLARRSHSLLFSYFFTLLIHPLTHQAMSSGSPPRSILIPPTMPKPDDMSDTTYSGAAPIPFRTNPFRPGLVSAQPVHIMSPDELVRDRYRSMYSRDEESRPRSRMRSQELRYSTEATTATVPPPRPPTMYRWNETQLAEPRISEDRSRYLRERLYQLDSLRSSPSSLSEWNRSVNRAIEGRIAPAHRTGSTNTQRELWGEIPLLPVDTEAESGHDLYYPRRSRLDRGRLEDTSPRPTQITKDMSSEQKQGLVRSIIQCVCRMPDEPRRKAAESVLCTTSWGKAGPECEKREMDRDDWCSVCHDEVSLASEALLNPVRRRHGNHTDPMQAHVSSELSRGTSQ